jgi:hypothetical protein
MAMSAEPRTARNERRRLQRLHPEAFKDGLLVGAGVKEGPREPGGYPKGFHQWELEKRNAWWAGANIGFLQKHQHRESADAP